MNFKVVQLSAYIELYGGGTYSSMLTSSDHESEALNLSEVSDSGSKPTTTTVIFWETSSWVSIKVEELR